MKFETRQSLELFNELLLKNAKNREITARNLQIFYFRVFNGMTLDLIGQEFGLSPERVRQIILKVNRQIKNFLQKKCLTFSVD
jgi:DNA-directed RNA polymerase sigma subunit (sigma70/sigma32)